ncbi:MAG: phenylalanine--tRNA ligase subunit beta [bacterium]|nr:phenylalanine--tRNA ligase subunit beta [bacterium]
MDFKLSYHWLREFVDTDLAPQELAEQLSLHSMSVERVHRMDEGLDPKVVVARVEKIEPHPNADKLRIATVAVRSAKSKKQGMGAVRVVCGGVNLREGMLVAFAPVGATVRWHGEGDPIVLAPATIRGEQSEGMICAASEIGLGAYFVEGEREILDLSDVLLDTTVGMSLAKALELDDVVLDVEVTTNRPDCMSVMGMAREVAAITGARVRAASRQLPASSPKRSKMSMQRAAGSLQLLVRVSEPKLCPMYSGTVISGVTVGPSPWWMQRRLLAGGIRPINNVVDVTNYVLLEMGQPLHAFDANTLQEGTIVVRSAKKGEEVAALDGKTYALTPEMLVIADAHVPIAIAGVIGGAGSAVTAQTASVVLEAATFDPISVRKTWRTLDVRTESSLRYEKGVPVESVPSARLRAVALLCAVAGGVEAGAPITRGKMPPPLRAVAVDLVRASEAIGIPLTAPRAKRVLTALGFRVAGASRTALRVTPPWWRRGDVEREHDVVEELARMAGYHALPSVLPEGALPAAAYPTMPPASMFHWEDRARDALAGVGAVEVMAFSMTSAATLAKCGFSATDAVALENPLTDELTHLRPSLVPALLEIVARNQGEIPEGLLFEMGNAWDEKQGTGNKEQGRRKSGLPPESMRLTIARYGNEQSSGELVRELRGAVDHLLVTLGVQQVNSSPSPRPRGEGEQKGEGWLWHPGRNAQLMVDNVPIATLGELHPTVARAFGIEHRVVVADIDWAVLLPLLGKRGAPASPPEYPAVKRDIAFVVARMTPYADLITFFASADPLLESATLFDAYEGKGIPAGKKSLAFHLAYRASNRTLTAEEVETSNQKIIATLQERFSATMRA